MDELVFLISCYVLLPFIVGSPAMVAATCGMDRGGSLWGCWGCCLPPCVLSLSSGDGDTMMEKK